MSIWPVIERELRLTSRQPYHHWVRVGFGAAAILASIAVLAANWRNQRMLGLQLFLVQGGLFMVFCLLSGCFLTADCLSSERRGGTLELLFLTPLRPWELVLGKLTFQSVQVFLYVMAVFPLLFLPVLHGGIGWGEVTKLICLLGVTLLLSLSIGMLISARAVQSTAAVLGTFLTILALSALPMVYLVVANEVFRRPFDVSGIPQLSAFSAFMVIPTGTPGVQSSFWLTLGLQFTLAIVALLLAVWFMNRSIRSNDPVPNANTHGVTGVLRGLLRPFNPFRLPQPATATVPPNPGSIPDETAGQPGHVSARRRPRLDNSVNPIAWRLQNIYRDAWWLRAFQWIMIAVFAFMLFLSATTRSYQETYTMAMLCAFALHLVTKVLLAVECSRWIHEDLQGGGLELLMATPLTNRRYLAGIWHGIRTNFIPHFKRLVMLNLALSAMIVLFFDHMNLDDIWLLFLSFFGFGIYFLFLDRRLIYWAGLHFGLKNNTHMTAVLRLLAVSIGVPWAFGAGVFLILVMVEPRDEEVIVLFYWFWAAVSLVYEKVQIRRLSLDVRQRLRSVGSEQ